MLEVSALTYQGVGCSGRGRARVTPWPAEANKRALVRGDRFHMGGLNAKGHLPVIRQGAADAMYPYPPKHARKVLEAAVELQGACSVQGRQQ